MVNRNVVLGTAKVFDQRMLKVWHTLQLNSDISIPFSPVLFTDSSVIYRSDNRNLQPNKLSKHSGSDIYRTGILLMTHLNMYKSFDARNHREQLINVARSYYKRMANKYKPIINLVHS